MEECVSRKNKKPPIGRCNIVSVAEPDAALPAQDIEARDRSGATALALACAQVGGTGQRRTVPYALCGCACAELDSYDDAMSVSLDRAMSRPPRR
jgi:hypothetical protein